jgi:hypothetical protein
MLEWMQRAKRVDTIAAERRQWRTRCGRYMVEESAIKYGRKRDSDGVYLGYPVIYRALIKRAEMWDILSEHRKRAAATAQCEHHAETGKLKPRQTKILKAKQHLKKKRHAKRKAKERGLEKNQNST